MSSNPMIPLLVSSTALFTLVAVYFIVFIILHKKKQRQNQLRQQQLKHAYESELLNSRLEIQEETLSRVSMEIHDGICQSLGALSYRLVGIGSQVPEGSEKISDATAVLNDNISKLRTISHTLNKAHVSIIGLHEAISEEIAFRKSMHPVDFQLDISGEDDHLPSETELLIFRIFQEAVSNSIRHGGATFIHIVLDYHPGTFRLSIKDNGAGFDLDTVNKRTGIGLLNMEQRVKLMNGNFDITSTIGQGVKIKLSLNH